MIVVYSGTLERELVRRQQRPPTPVPHNTPREPARAKVWKLLTAEPTRWWCSSELARMLNGYAGRVRVSDITAQFYQQGLVERRADPGRRGFGRIWRYRVKA